jgi:hypothetical protein
MSPVGSGIDSSDTSLSDRMDDWISRQHTLLVVAQETLLRSPIILSIHMYYIHLQWVVVTSYFPDIEDHIKLEDNISLCTS